MDVVIALVGGRPPTQESCGQSLCLFIFASFNIIWPIQPTPGYRPSVATKYDCTMVLSRFEAYYRLINDTDSRNMYKMLVQLVYMHVHVYQMLSSLGLCKTGEMC